MLGLKWISVSNRVPRSPVMILIATVKLPIPVGRHHYIETDLRAPFQYPIRRLIVRSREVSKPRDLYLELSDRSEIWQAPWQHCYRGACQISNRYQSRGFETYDMMFHRILKRYPGPCLTTAIQWKLHSHWLKFLRQRHVAVVRQDPGRFQQYQFPEATTRN